MVNPSGIGAASPAYGGNTAQSPATPQAWDGTLSKAVEIVRVLRTVHSQALLQSRMDSFTAIKEYQLLKWFSRLSVFIAFLFFL
jgi:hypothetical protein